MVLNAEGLELDLVETPMGPLVSTAAGRYEPLAWALNLAVTGVLPGLDATLAKGEELRHPHCAVVRPSRSTDLDAAGELWHLWTGQPLGDDVYEVSVEFLDAPLVLPRRVLAGVLHELQRLRAAAPKPSPPWVFRRDPRWNEPAPDEDAPLRELEQRAARWDALREATPLVPLAPGQEVAAAELLVRRRQLLAELEEHGLFTDAFGTVKMQALRRWGLPVLAGYAESAWRLFQYLRSPERDRWALPAPSKRLLEDRVSVDWFRLPHEGVNGPEPFATLAFCEDALRRAKVPDAPAGELYALGDRGWWRLAWRRDLELTPALVAARLDEAHFPSGESPTP